MVLSLILEKNMETKSSIRKEKLALRSLLLSEDRSIKNESIAKRVLSHPWVIEADAVLCYASYQSEADTFAIMEELWNQKKKVYLPRVAGETMEFYRIHDLSEVVSGYKGIPEPITDCKEQFEENQHANVVMIMPGCAFTKSGARIGYGKGYYDRYLEKHDIVKRVAICFSLQLAEELPTDKYDKKAEILITEDETIDCSMYR